MTNLLTQAQVQALARKVGFSTKANGGRKAPDDRIISALAMCEGVTDASTAATIRDKRPYSDFDAIGDQALANDYWGYSYSGLQIRSVRSQKGTGGLRDELRLPVPEFALMSALQIWRVQGPQAWSTFLSGQYEAYLPDLYPTAPGTYRVLAGDTLSRIADKLRVGTWQDIARVNAIRSPYTIYIGQALLLPFIEYTVRPGDTLTKIVADYGDGVTVQRVAEFNHLSNPDMLSVGQVLRIPKAAL